MKGYNNRYESPGWGGKGGVHSLYATGAWSCGCRSRGSDPVGVTAKASSVAPERWIASSTSSSVRPAEARAAHAEVLYTQHGTKNPNKDTRGNARKGVR